MAAFQKNVPPYMERPVVGARVWFLGEKKPYKIQAVGERYFVCTKPFNPKRTVLYCIVDTYEQTRGPENLVFGMGAETQQQCEEMIGRLEDAPPEGRTEVSSRNRVELIITRFEAPPA